MKAKDIKKWRPIEGSDGFVISNFGDVMKDGFLYKHIVQRGYHRVAVTYGDKRKIEQIHRLVAKAFVANPFNKTEVNHKNGDTHNNCEWNLEWCTPYENQMHRRYVLGKDMDGEHNPMYGKCGVESPRFKDYIVAVDEDGNLAGRFATQTEAAMKMFNKYTKSHAICNILARRKGCKTCGGYYWFYEQDYLRMKQADLKPRELLETPKLLGGYRLGQSAAKPYISGSDTEL